MKKTKFKINGMHCNSCAILIEEKLKNLPGVIQTKISYESGKGVIVYDENVIKETGIQSEIEAVGKYSVEKIEDTEEKNIGKDPFSKFKEMENSSYPNLSMSIPIIIAGLGLIVAGAVIVDGGSSKKTVPIRQTVQVQDSPSKQQPSNLPTGQPSIVQTFEITKDNHIRGDFNAPITLVEFSCFECPFSARHNPTLIKIIDDYKGKVRVVYKHFPLDFHPNAQKAAESSECAAEQNKFWEYHDKLFENLQIGYSIENFKQWAKDLGLNSAKFNDCLDSDKYANKVQADSQEGTQKGVDGTPATFVNGQLVSGAVPYESFKQIIDNLPR